MEILFSGALNDDIMKLACKTTLNEKRIIILKNCVMIRSRKNLHLYQLRSALPRPSQMF